MSWICRNKKIIVQPFQCGINWNKMESMRTIKFRGRDEHGCWHIGWLAGTNDGTIYIAENDEGWTDDGFHNDDFSGWYKVLEKTIGQFTGLFDKNGKEIYEGDILRKPAKEQWEIKNFVGYEVFWHDNDCADNHIGWQMNRHHYNGCLCGTTDFVRCLPKYCCQMEVIGNIHDNPELLEGGKNDD